MGMSVKRYPLKYRRWARIARELHAWSVFFMLSGNRKVHFCVDSRELLLAV